MSLSLFSSVKKEILSEIYAPRDVGSWDLSIDVSEISPRSINQLLNNFHSAFDWVQIYDIQVCVDFENMPEEAWKVIPDSDWNSWFKNYDLKGERFLLDTGNFRFSTNVLASQKDKQELLGINDFGYAQFDIEEGRLGFIISVSVDLFTPEAYTLERRKLEFVDIGKESRRKNRQVLRDSLAKFEKAVNGTIASWETEHNYAMIDKYGFKEEDDPGVLNFDYSTVH